MIDKRQHCPIKLVSTSQADHVSLRGGGSDPKRFCEVTAGLRQELISQVTEVRAYFSEVWTQMPSIACVGKLKLKNEALAKSHRPTALLTNETCPIIGHSRLGELLLSLTPAGLDAFAYRLATTDSKRGKAALTCIESITPRRPGDSLAFRDGEIVADALKVQLFGHRDPIKDRELFEGFLRYCSGLGLSPPKRMKYGPLSIFRVITKKPSDVEEIAKYVGTQSVSHFGTVNAVRASAVISGSISFDDFPHPEVGTDYPVVGLVDTGTNPEDIYIGPWVSRRLHDYVADSETCYKHASMVGALLVHGERLNHSRGNFPAGSCKIVDVCAIPARDLGRTTEDEVLEVLEDAIRKNPDVKVWNLSFSLENELCDSHCFSTFGAALDCLQAQYQVIFVVPTGNLASTPYRVWPPTGEVAGDELSPPADSVRAVTVSSIAHIDGRGAGIGDPSPFSRKGPGPLYLPKPELSHRGGNCDSNGTFRQTGILSMDGYGNLVEDKGTSLAVPFVSSLLAQLMHRSNLPLSNHVAKALLIHSAALRRDIRNEMLPYLGFGCPPDVDQILEADPSSGTLLFTPGLMSSKEFERWPLPIPSSLRTADGKLKAEFIATLVCEVPLDASMGAEYVRSNVELSIGTYDPNEAGKREQSGKVPLVPKTIGKMYEKHLVENGFKWSPVKVYQQKFPRGVAGTDWRLSLKVHHRDGYIAGAPVPVALLVTIRDFSQANNGVNEEVANLIRTLKWDTTDLQTQESQQVRTRPT